MAVEMDRKNAHIGTYTRRCIPQGAKSWLLNGATTRVHARSHVLRKPWHLYRRRHLGGQFLPRRNKCRRRPISDTCVVSHTYRNTPLLTVTTRQTLKKIKTAKGKRSGGTSVDSNVKGFAAHRCVGELYVAPPTAGRRQNVRHHVPSDAAWLTPNLAAAEEVGMFLKILALCG